MSARLPAARALRLVALAAALASGACAPSLGPFVLEAVRGRVVDENTAEPIRGATVIQWYRGAGTGGGPQPSYHARFATTDREGRFAFERAVAPSPRMWLLETYGPGYGFYHPSYGLETATPQRVDRSGGGPAELRLGGSLRRAHLRLDALSAWCAGRHAEDAASEHLREIACPLEAHEAWPSGVPRAEGSRDARGRRTGTWTFTYADGSVAARGRYEAGGAVGEWSYYDREGRRVGGEASAPLPHSD